MNLGQRKGLILSLSPTEKGAGDLQLHVGSLCSLIPTLLPVSCFRRCVDLAHGNGFLLWLTPLDPRSQTTLGSAITRTRPRPASHRNPFPPSQPRFRRIAARFDRAADGVRQSRLASGGIDQGVPGCLILIWITYSRLTSHTVFTGPY